MVAVLAALTPAPTGAIAAYQVVDAGEPVNVDVDDLELTGAGLDLRLDDDELTIVVTPSTVLAAGPHTFTLAVASLELDLDLEATFATIVAAGRYGATIAGVEALVANLTVSYSSNPSAADVTRWLDDIGGRVAVRLGDLDELTALDPVAGALYVTRARDLVHLGAGAYTEDAAHPERTSSQGDARYGAVLWARFEAGLEELAALVADARDAAGVAPVTGLVGAAGSFPEPMFYRDRDLI